MSESVGGAAGKRAGRAMRRADRNPPGELQRQLKQRCVPVERLGRRVEAEELLDLGGAPVFFEVEGEREGRRLRQEGKEERKRESLPFFLPSSVFLSTAEQRPLCALLSSSVR